MSNDSAQPIIIKKVKKGGDHGHHGGAWKIAYADFVTAMMAFFLLMWLLNATTEEQKRGIANYFDPITIGERNGGGEGVMGGQSVTSSENAGQASTNPTSIQESKPREKGHGGKTEESRKQETDEAVMLEEAADFESIKEEIQKNVENSSELKEWLQNLIIEETPEGLRIQIVDQEGRSMFPSGSSQMYGYTRKLLEQVAHVVAKVSNKLSISGHTDAMPYNTKNYTNWELSSDRALASRRVMLESGLPESRFASVVGREAKEPFKKEDPFAPQNRRISIVLLRQNGPLKSTPPKGHETTPATSKNEKTEGTAPSPREGKTTTSPLKEEQKAEASLPKA